MKRTCIMEGCTATTSKPLSDFADIGWSAMSMNNGKAVCLCPEHSKDPDRTYLLLRKASKGLFP